MFARPARTFTQIWQSFKSFRFAIYIKGRCFLWVRKNARGEWKNDVSFECNSLNKEKTGSRNKNFWTLLEPEPIFKNWWFPLVLLNFICLICYGFYFWKWGAATICNNIPRIRKLSYKYRNDMMLMKLWTTRLSMLSHDGRLGKWSIIIRR